MDKKKDECCAEGKYGKMGRSNASGGALYGMGFIGALVYFLGHAGTFWIGVLGVLKAIVWPALLVFKLLDFFKM